MEEKEGNVSVESFFWALLCRTEEAKEVRKEGRPLLCVRAKEEEGERMREFVTEDCNTEKH